MTLQEGYYQVECKTFGELKVPFVVFTEPIAFSVGQDLH